MNAYSLVLRTHPLPSFNINELGFSQSSCFLLVLKGVISRALSTGVEHMQAMLGFFKNRLVEAKGERLRFFFLMRLLKNDEIQNVEHELKEDLQTKID